MGIVFGKIAFEAPAHTTLLQAQGYQIRRYPPSVTAAVYASDLPSDKPASLTGQPFRAAAFEILARYTGVFRTPENTAAPSPQLPDSPAHPVPVAMTVPVIVHPRESRRGDSIRFLLPAKYRAVEDAPRPNNDIVKLEMIPGGRVDAVLVYSGNFDIEVAAQRANDLTLLLQKDNIQPVGEWTAHGYNPPFTLPWCKTNEIHISLDPSAYPEDKQLVK